MKSKFRLANIPDKTNQIVRTQSNLIERLGSISSEIEDNRIKKMYESSILVDFRTQSNLMEQYKNQVKYTACLCLCLINFNWFRNLKINNNK